MLKMRRKIKRRQKKEITMVNMKRTEKGIEKIKKKNLNQKLKIRRSRKQKRYQATKRALKKSL
jgi:hypothetical protein